MLTLKKLRAGSLVVGILLLALSSLGCSNGQIPPAWDANPYSTLNWTPDSTQIVFSRSVQGTFVVDVTGTRLHTIPTNAPLGDLYHPGSVAAALSPDGSRVAYVALFSDGLYGASNAEIMIASIAGTSVRRLTRNVDSHDTHPVWSPDGNYIAYLSGDKLAVMTVDEGNVQALPLSVVSGGFGPVWSPDGSRLAYLVWDEEIAHGVPYVMRLDGSDIVKLGDAVVVGEPAWSPDGSRIAYLGFEESEDDKVLYVARPDGSEVLDLGKAASPPAWSPDGNRIAFFQQEKGLRLYTANPDGTGRRLVLTLGRIGEWRPGALSWSPDGSTLLFASYYLSIYERYEQGPWHLVNIEDEKIVADFEGETPEWSPDGSRIAVLANMCKRFGDGGFMEDCDPNDQDVLYTLARDGTDRQVLVRATNDRQSTKYERLNADFIRRDVPRRQAVCAVRYADNAGLSQDCETLLALRDKLGGDAFLNWHNSIPMARWQGVTIEGNPPRVHGLHIPIASGASPVLKGVLPSELGNLSELRRIDFSGNALTGELPAELGNLIKLERLVLYENNLTGSIPAELGNLSALQGLYLGGNDLSGSIPAELGNLAKLEELDLKDNSLTGSIPAALDNLNEVKVLLLQDNGLTGSLPPELGNLENLKTLDVSGNDLTDCVPKVLSERTPNVFTDGLESCAE